MFGFIVQEKKLTFVIVKGDKVDIFLVIMVRLLSGKGNWAERQELGKGNGRARG